MILAYSPKNSIYLRSYIFFVKPISMNYYRSSILVLLLLLCACEQQPRYSALDIAFHLSDQNRPEMEKVLDRYSMYPEDSLKYRAAVFLIENMPYYYSYEGEMLDKYDSYYRALNEHRFKRHVKPELILDSIVNIHGRFSPHTLEVKYDILTVDSAFLCNNIEWAFKVWEEQPWGKNVSFEDFCEYVLPYRIGDERLESNWREMYYNLYNPLLDSLRLDSTVKDADDPITAVKLLMETLAKHDSAYYTGIGPSGMPHVGPTTALNRSGSCGELTDFVVYTCRALGIPCFIDFMPLRGDNNVGHFWVGFKSKDNDYYAQHYPEPVKTLQADGVRFDPKMKTYRYTFSINHEEKKKMESLDPTVPVFFRRPRLIDVTYHYSGHNLEQLCIPKEKIYKKKSKGKIAYLCGAQQTGWSPVAWTPFDRGNLSFPYVQKGTIMRIATWEDDQLVFQTDPFRIDPLSNEMQFFSPEKDSLEEVVLLSKFPLGQDDFFRNRMLGGVFEGSNDPNFKTKDTLWVVHHIPQRLFTAVEIVPKKPYRYVRYYGADGTHCNIAEALFFENPNDTASLTGQVIGTPGCFQQDGSHEYTNVFDGLPWTSYDYKDPSGGWAGLDLGEPRYIAKIAYTPRNRDNYIRPGDRFELFYCDDEWESLGIVIPETDSLVYQVPKNALLYLKNHSRGVQERIFLYREGKQIWE